MDAATEHAASILKVAWARALGIGDTDLTAARTHVTIPEVARQLTFLNLFGSCVFLGPDWAVERAARIPNEHLGSERGLLEIAKDRSAHRARAETILFTPDYLPPPSMHPSQAPLISRDREMVERLERRCPPDDVAAAGLLEQTHWFTLLEESMDPVACTAYREWQGFVANMTALTVPEARRQGYARTVALIATNVALDEGLVPQWRAHRTNTSAWHLAESLGFQRIGVLATVSFT